MSAVYSNTNEVGNSGLYKLNKHNNDYILKVGSSSLGITGEIRYNNELNILQGFDGKNWINFRDNIVLNEELDIKNKIDQLNKNISEYKTKIRQIENILIENGKMRKIMNELAESYKKKLLDCNPSKIKTFKMGGDTPITIGSVVVISGDCDGIPVVSIYKNGRNMFNECCNVVGIVESVMDNGMCTVVVEGPVNVWLSNAADNTEFQKSVDIKNGVMCILDKNGKIYQPMRKPLTDFIQIGFSMENTVYTENSKMIKIWVKPDIHFL